MTIKLFSSVAITLLPLFVGAQYVAEILPTPNGSGRAAAAGGGQIVGGAFGFGGGPSLWDGPSHNWINLSPQKYDFAETLGVGGGQQSGYGSVDGTSHALVWAGSAGSVTDLHPGGYSGSFARATDGSSQVGDAPVAVNQSHAALWQGTAGSFVDLHPNGYKWSIAYGVDGGIQVGAAENQQAMWNGTSSSFALLPKPKGFGGGAAVAVGENQIVGNAAWNGSAQAVMWNLSTMAFTHLGSGFAFDTNGSVQVGYRGLPFESRAIAWFGSKASELDLHQFLPKEFSSSQALGVDENGWIVGWGHITGGNELPIVWTPVPEPTTVAVLAVGLFVLAMRKRD